MVIWNIDIHCACCGVVLGNDYYTIGADDNDLLIYYDIGMKLCADCLYK